MHRLIWTNLLFIHTAAHYLSKDDTIHITITSILTLKFPQYFVAYVHGALYHKLVIIFTTSTLFNSYNVYIQLEGNHSLFIRDKLRLKVDFDFNLLRIWNGLNLTKLVWFNRRALSSWILNSWTDPQLDWSLLLLAGPLGFMQTKVGGLWVDEARWISRETMLPHFL